MSPKANSKKTIVEQLLDDVNEISIHYQTQFAQNEDIKALQGMERCVELRMKICGLDGKQQPLAAIDAEPTLSLSQLPIELLQNIINHIKTMPMQQHKL